MSSMSQDHRTISAGVPRSAQPNPISAVEEQAALHSLIDQLKGGVKTVAPIAASGGLLGLLAGPGEASASVPEQPQQWAQWDDAWGADPPLEKPTVDPIDMLIAPLGAASWPARATAPAVEAALGYAGEKLPGLLDDYFWNTDNRSLRPD